MPKIIHLPTANVTTSLTTNTLVDATSAATLEMNADGCIVLNGMVYANTLRVTGCLLSFNLYGMKFPNTTPVFILSITDDDGSLWPSLQLFFGSVGMLTQLSDPTMLVSPIVYVGPTLILDTSMNTIPCTVLHCKRTRRYLRVVSFRYVTILNTQICILSLHLSDGRVLSSKSVHFFLISKMMQTCTFHPTMDMYICEYANTPEAIAMSAMERPIHNIPEIDALIVETWNNTEQNQMECCSIEDEKVSGPMINKTTFSIFEELNDNNDIDSDCLDFF